MYRAPHVISKLTEEFGAVSTSSPYVFERTSGAVHIRLRNGDGSCVACVRLDAADILWAEGRREGIAEALEAAKRIAKGEQGLIESDRRRDG